MRRRKLDEWATKGLSARAEGGSEADLNILSSIEGDSAAIKLEEEGNSKTGPQMSPPPPPPSATKEANQQPASSPVLKFDVAKFMAKPEKQGLPTPIRPPKGGFSTFVSPPSSLSGQMIPVEEAKAQPKAVPIPSPKKVKNDSATCQASQGPVNVYAGTQIIPE